LGRNAGLQGTTVEVSEDFLESEKKVYLVHDIFKRIGTIDGEADE
jgi:hypothetical protein